MTHPTATAPGRVAVVGDIGGHSHQLRLLLTRLGVTFDLDRRTRPTGHEWAIVDYRWPAGLRVVSAGDLIHRGPDSLGVLVLIDRLIADGVWSQVVGNHEQLYVDRPVFGWEETLHEDGQQLLRDWWGDRRMAPSVGINSDTGPHLVTHAGLTHGFATLVLGRPTTLEETVARLREVSETGELWLPGLMLGYDRNLAAGPVWAEAAGEVFTSWALAAAQDETAPFHQVHGHSSAFWWDRKEWRIDADAAPYLDRFVTFTVDAGRRHVSGQVAGSRITGVDPGHLQSPAPVFAPLILTGATTLT